MIRTPLLSPLSLPGAILLAAFAAACSEAPTAAPEVPDALGAKGGVKGPPGGGGGGDDGTASDPTVTGTDPGSAPQDTRLDVRVFGTGFDPGSQADFLLNGKATRKVKTNSTIFVGEGELIADITIAADAETELYDVRVTTSRGKKGVGIEMFEVTGPTAVLTSCTLDAAGDCVSGTPEGLYEDGLGFYVGWFNVNTKSKDEGNFNVNAPCEEGRRMNVMLPSTWLLFGSPSPCNAGPGSGATGRAHFHVPDLLQADGSCAGGEPCPIGVAEPGTTPTGFSFSPNLHHHFWFDADGDGLYDENAANLIWTDGRYTVERRGSDGATPCAWHVTAGAADLWVGDQRAEPTGESVALDVHLARYDGPCATGI